jgi:hypothetical protein
MTDTCFIFKNLFNYDKIGGIPSKLPKNMKCLYITDSTDSCKKAKALGWDTIFVNKYVGISDPFEKRKVIAEINCYPERFIDTTKFKYAFICDSNVVALDSNYSDFVSKKSDDKALYLTSGWYSGVENTIHQELKRSLQNERWLYNFDKILISAGEYVTYLTEKGTNLADTPVVSAKYIGWNITHPMKRKISDYVYNEYIKHLQGNLIFSMALQIYPEHIEHYTKFMNDGKVSTHSVSL